MDPEIISIHMQSLHSRMIALQIKQTHTMYLLMDSETQLSLIMNQYAETGEYALQPADRLRVADLNMSITEYKEALNSIMSEVESLQQSVSRLAGRA